MAIMFLTISGVTVPMTGSCLQVMASSRGIPQGKRLILQCWQEYGPARDDSEETLTLTEDGLFVYHKAAGDTQGYMEYVENITTEMAATICIIVLVRGWQAFIWIQIPAFIWGKYRRCCF